jgi:hypothetical protein
MTKIFPLLYIRQNQMYKISMNLIMENCSYIFKMPESVTEKYPLNFTTQFYLNSYKTEIFITLVRISGKEWLMLDMAKQF